MIGINNDLNELNKIRYDCKHLFSDICYDPVLSGVMFEFLYNHLSHIRGVKINNFYYNDSEKYIDFKFEKRKDVMQYKVYISKAFEDLYKYLVYTPLYFNRLLAINYELANTFSTTVTNEMHLISNFGFDLYNILLLENSENEVYIRINLV